jgi:hypothetical protein
MATFLYSDVAGVPNRFDFTNQTSITVTHGLGYTPNVWIVVDGVEVYGEIHYNNLLTFTVIFETVETGVIYYR